MIDTDAETPLVFNGISFVSVEGLEKSGLNLQQLFEQTKQEIENLKGEDSRHLIERLTEGLNSIQQHLSAK